MNSWRVSAFCVAIALAGCSGSSNHSNYVPPTMNPTVTTVSYTDYMKTLLALTSETAIALEVNDAMLTFADDNNPAAFDSVVGPPG
jgi:hypothetical protein